MVIAGSGGTDAIQLSRFDNGFGGVTLSFIGAAVFAGLNQVRRDNGLPEVSVTGGTGAEFRLIRTGIDELDLSDLIPA